ncbi:MAG: hypothetical protein C0467_24635 [Planctomycetaceae bacterium]|nr:hypothetical protein [Planctomycetaceae bacterium]
MGVRRKSAAFVLGKLNSPYSSAGRNPERSDTMPRPTPRNPKSTNKKPKFTEPVPTVSLMPVSLGLANKLRELDHYLFREFGGNFSYVIGGQGKILSASNAISGIVVPSVKDEPLEGRVISESELWQVPEGTKVEHPVYGPGEIKRAHRVDDTDLDDRVAVFGNVSFVLPAVKLDPQHPWDCVVKLTLPKNAEISTSLSTRA